MSDFKRLEQKLDRIDTRLDNVDATLIKQHSNLEEHMRRSLAAEMGIQALGEELKPIKAHVLTVQAIAKFLGLTFKVGIGIGTMVGSALGVLKLLGKF